MLNGISTKLYALLEVRGQVEDLIFDDGVVNELRTANCELRTTLPVGQTFLFCASIISADADMSAGCANSSLPLPFCHLLSSRFVPVCSAHDHSPEQAIGASLFRQIPSK
jgi:hypothetical protein